MPTTTVELGDTLYEDVAKRVCRLIESGTLRAGDKLPSVRKLSQQFGVSVSTVLQAYRLLEDRGQIEARPQSGYYVRTGFWHPPAEPDITAPPPGATPVRIADLAEHVMLEARRPDLVHLGASTHGSDAMPVRQLNRVAAAVARRSPGLAAHYCVTPGDEMLRVQIARRAIDAGITLSPDEILITSGAQEAMAMCLRAACRPGDAVAIESPSYYGLLQLLDVLGLRAVEV
ncbi:MAG: helix-turn-helix transcriptional regulator with aminotransferase domain, GntR family, partial [Phycisphaerales bacterium]|nr:helix-turn-helix transcriptional regulator with aminotransferase domain, GntR family [Phycisphaerales bacterium]